MNKKIISKAIAGTILCSMFAYVTPVFAYTKEETVYSKADSNGKVYKTIASEHLENTDKDQIINDLSDLLNIENTKGDETFSQDGTKLVWQADGNDIYYQGETEKELPIKTEIKYELDGQEISAEEIKGKSGKVKVIINYTNNEKRGDMYVPFVVIAGTIINNDKATNVEVTNGKAINDGTKTMVMGIAMPGLQESLGLSTSDIEIPSSIEITMHTTDFEQKNIMTYATSKVFEESDLKVFDKMDELFDHINQLESASKQLVTGANTLSDGARQFSGKSKEFNSAMKKYADGVASANTNYTKLNDGIAKLDASSSELEAGAKQLYDGLSALMAATSGISGENNTEQIAKLQNAVAAETQELEGLKAIKNNGLIENQKAANNQMISTLTEQLTAEGKTAEQIAANSQIVSLKTLNAGLDSQSDANDAAIQILEGQIAANNQIIALLTATDTSAVSALKTSIQQLQAGSGLVYNGTVALTNGTAELKAGSAQMKEGLNTLDNSTKQLLAANGQLTDAAETVYNGSEELAEGITKFNEEGIEKIVHAVNGKGKDVVDKVKKLKDLSKEYNSFTMLDEGNEGTTQFITVVDAVTSEED